MVKLNLTFVKTTHYIYRRGVTEKELKHYTPPTVNLIVPSKNYDVCEKFLLMM